MRRLLVLACALTLTACSSSREAQDDGYVIREDGSGNMNIAVPDGASGETVMAALTDAAGRIEWTPPEAAAGLRQVRQEDLGGDGTAYLYGLEGGRFHVFVYRSDQDAEAQVAGTQAALRQLRDDGRIDGFALVGRRDRVVPWEGDEATLTRVRFEEEMGGVGYDSYMYLLPDGAWWVKVRASFPEGRYRAQDLDEMVEALLAEGE